MYSTEEGHVALEHDVVESVRKVGASQVSVLSALSAAAAMFFAVLSITNAAPLWSIWAATISVGAALFFEGLSAVRNYSSLEPERVHPWSRFMMGFETFFSVTGGLAGIILGTLGLVGVSPTQIPLLTASSIVLGGSMFLSCGILAYLDRYIVDKEQRKEDWLGHETVSALVGVEALVGLAAVTLGIICYGMTIINLAPIALIALGAAAFMATSALYVRTLRS